MLRHVHAGEPLVITADDYNACLEAARARQMRQFDRGPAPVPALPAAGRVLIKNTSAAHRVRGDVLGITGVLFTRQDNPGGFYAGPVLTGTTPDADDHTGKFVVLAEPLAAGKLGHALIDGLCVTRVKMNSEDDRFADVRDGDATQLDSAGSGLAQLLWIEPAGQREVTGTAVCLVRLGGAASPVECVRITAFDAGNKAFLCKRIDDAGNVTGAQFRVYALSYAYDSPVVGSHDLAQCNPQYVIGNSLRIQRQRNYITNPTNSTLQWVDGYFALATFNQYECGG